MKALSRLLIVKDKRKNGWTQMSSVLREKFQQKKEKHGSSEPCFSENGTKGCKISILHQSYPFSFTKAEVY